MTALTLVVTTLDNAATLARCLESVRGLASEIVVLDSGSTDDTRAIAEAAGARVHVEPFKGYGPQKASAIAKSSNDWVLLLDADEALTDACRDAIARALASRDEAIVGIEIPRREQLFWTFQHESARHNPMLRVFDRRQARFTDSTIHAAPAVEGRTIAIAEPFLHYGEPDVATKVAKINHYSSGAVGDKRAQRVGFVRTRMLVQPPLQFLKNYVVKRRFLSGWAGFIGAAIDAFYVFLKYAKLLEAEKRERSKPDA